METESINLVPPSDEPVNEVTISTDAKPEPPTYVPDTASENPTSVPDEPASVDEAHSANPDQPTPVDETMVSDEAKPDPPSTVQPTETTVPDEPREHVLKFKAKARTRIRAEIDDETVKDFTLRPGESHSIKAFKSFELLISNAGGVETTLDGKPLEPFGELGEARRKNLTFAE